MSMILKLMLFLIIGSEIVEAQPNVTARKAPVCKNHNRQLKCSADGRVCRCVKIKPTETERVELETTPVNVSP
jgi:hypothetical protein